MPAPPQRVIGEAAAVEAEVSRLGAVYASTGAALERARASRVDAEARLTAEASAAMSSLYDAVHARRLAERSSAHWSEVAMGERERAGAALRAERAGALEEARGAKERAANATAFAERTMGACECACDGVAVAMRVVLFVQCCLLCPTACMCVLVSSRLLLLLQM